MIEKNFIECIFTIFLNYLKTEEISGDKLLRETIYFGRQPWQKGDNPPKRRTNCHFTCDSSYDAAPITLIFLIMALGSFKVGPLGFR